MVKSEMKIEPVGKAKTGFRIRLFIGYHITVGAVFLAALFPENRIWGFNQWAFFSNPVKIFLLLTAVVLPIVLEMITRKWSVSIYDRFGQGIFRDRNYYFITAVVTISSLITFYFLRSKTHFLGDGYLNLSSLASAKPFVKDTAIGAIKAHIWLKSHMGGNDEATALLTFQVISILSGVLFLLAIFYLARKLFREPLDSTLFGFGMASGGYTLLFFGYVEYYALFVLSVTIYTLAGLLIVNGKLNKWLALLFFALTVFFHVLSISLLPSTLYLLSVGTRVEKFFLKLSSRKKWSLTLLAGVISISVLTFYYSNSYRLRFTMMPIVSDRFTVEGYTLFSLKHLFDIINLIFLMFPGFLIYLFLLPRTLSRQFLHERSFQFLLILSLSTLCAVFLVDPKLGMPRDWDLLSYFGVPLCALGYYSVVTRSESTRKYIAIALMMLLGLFSLFPRALRQSSPQSAIAEFKSYALLDITKNKTGRKLLAEYYWKSGDTNTAKIETLNWYNDFPEGEILYQVDSLLRINVPREAVRLATQAIQKNPMNHSAYFALGKGYLVSNNIDSAIEYVKIANAMNPGSSEYLYFLGSAYFLKGNIKESEKAFNKSVELSENEMATYSMLLELFNSPKHKEIHDAILSRAAQKSDATPEILADYGKYLLNKGEIYSGRAYIKKAIEKGLDSAYLKQQE